MQDWFVVVMGLCTVFIVLILIIALCYILGAVCQKLVKDTKTSPSKTVPSTNSDIPNRPEFVAAVSAAIAEASGTDASGIRILSIKKL